MLDKEEIWYTDVSKKEELLAEAVIHRSEGCKGIIVTQGRFSTVMQIEMTGVVSLLNFLFKESITEEYVYAMTAIQPLQLY